MAAPKDPIGEQNIEAMVDADHELWSVTTYILAKKGTNLEEELALMNQYFKNGSDFSTLPETKMVSQKTVDISKL